jgi:hypothetical protein
MRLTRRTFLLSSAGAAAATAVPPSFRSTSTDDLT